MASSVACTSGVIGLTAARGEPDICRSEKGQGALRCLAILRVLPPQGAECGKYHRMDDVCPATTACSKDSDYNFKRICDAV